MRLKSFHGATSSEAMRRVREALGEDAIIVATREDETGGVRVTAAIDDAPAPTAAAPEPVSLQMRPEEPEGSDAVATIAEALMRHQVPTHLAERLLATATQCAHDDPIVALGAAFDTHFKFQPILDDRSERSTLVLIGPPGVGKTLCIAKLATKATIGKRPVAVISTDIERAGGMEQLAAFTRLLKINLVEVEDAHALQDIIAVQKDSQVFVDTPGRNPFDPQERQQVQALVKACGGAATLVLPAGIDGSEAVDMAQEFRALGATRLLVTRMDMARRLGSVLRVAYDARLPLANASYSGKVTEAPYPLNPVALARFILPNHPVAVAKTITSVS